VAVSTVPQIWVDDVNLIKLKEIGGEKKREEVGERDCVSKNVHVLLFFSNSSRPLKLS